MSEPLPQKEIPHIECTSFQLTTGVTDTYVLRANNSGVGTWQVGGGSSENIECKTFRLSTDPGADLVLTSDAIGNGTWEPFPNTDDIKCTSFQLTTSPINNYVLTSNGAGIGAWEPQISNTPANGLEYAILENSSPSVILPNVNTAINWNTINFNTINNLVITGRQFQNISNTTMYLLVTFNAYIMNNPTMGQAWINVQPTTDNPNNPATLEYTFNGITLTTSNASSISILVTSIVTLPPGYSINTPVKSNVLSQIGSATENQKSYCQIFRVA